MVPLLGLNQKDTDFELMKHFQGDKCESEDEHYDFELQHYKNKPIKLINEIFMKLSIYEQIKNCISSQENRKVEAYLQNKVSKMQREYLELLFMMIFENISNKDQVIEMIARGQLQQNSNK